MISLKGSNLNIKGLGSMRLELVILCVLLGVFISYNLACDCCKPRAQTFFSKMFSREGFRLNPSNLNDNNLQHTEIYNGLEIPFRLGETQLKFGGYYAIAYSNYSNLLNMFKFGLNVFNPFTNRWAF